MLILLSISKSVFDCSMIFFHLPFKIYLTLRKSRTTLVTFQMGSLIDVSLFESSYTKPGNDTCSHSFPQFVQLTAMSTFRRDFTKTG